MDTFQPSLVNESKELALEHGARSCCPSAKHVLDHAKRELRGCALPRKNRHARPSLRVRSRGRLGLRLKGGFVMRGAFVNLERARDSEQVKAPGREQARTVELVDITEHFRHGAERHRLAAVGLDREVGPGPRLSDVRRPVELLHDARRDARQ